MNMLRIQLIIASFLFLLYSHVAYANLTLTAGNNATTTPNVATSITGFQIVGPSGSTTPVRLRSTHGTLSMTTTSGLTFSGASSGTSVSFTGTVANINAALATLKYSRSSTGTDTLEISLVEPGEVFFADNGHLYKYVSGSYTWSAAKTAAEAQSAYGTSGYLATITSSAENNFVYARISGNGWIGAADTDTEKTWKWMTGPETGTTFFQENASGGGGSAVSGRYNAWYSGEPNDYFNGNPGEDCAHMYSTGGQAGTWNDFPCSSSLGYVVEFGSDGSLPTVVATNISIVTADVPAITTLSPSNGSTTVTPSQNLVIGFSKTVTKETGNILIRKVSDDSVVQTIDASGNLVSGSGTNSITINPASDLEEGVQYYVTIPSTSFKDSSNNFFNGITASTTWVFTVADVTAPQITNITSEVSSTTATVDWNTNELASSRLWYSANTAYASSSSEINTSPRVSTHEISLGSLVPCTLYHYRAVSKDATGNTATSSNNTFTTTGCSGGVIPTEATSTSVTVSSPATSTLAYDDRTFSVRTPSNVTATSSTIVIQIKSMPATTTLSSIGKPSSSLHNSSSVVFDVTALINNETVLDSFDVPVTISYTYTDEDVVGIDEGSLSMYHYRDNTWNELDDCEVNTNTNVITCTAPHFSIFAIFGNPIVQTSSSRSSAGTSIQSRYNNLLAMGNVAGAESIKKEWDWLFESKDPVSQSVLLKSLPVRDLEIGMTGDDVLLLQKFLNTQGFVLAQSGVGSPGNETLYFGSLTKKALSAFQRAHDIYPSQGYFGSKTRGIVQKNYISNVWWK